MQHWFPDFSSPMYEKLLTCLLETGYITLTVAEYIELGPDNCDAPDPVVILRHDVDRRIGHASSMASLEAKIKVRSTYYFRYPSTFHPETISDIFYKGHEIGYHFEVCSKAKGNTEIARDIFTRELREFRKIVPVRTVAMHGTPVSGINNQQFFSYFRPDDFVLIGDAYLDMQHTHYFSDTGRRWDGKNAIYDRFPGKCDKSGIVGTQDLISYVSVHRPSPLYLTIHPERWSLGMADHLYSYSFDLGVNLGKRWLAKRR